eukprot:TRINITY_DN14453_c0_g1_i4.p1 TRINITY_DN14453_c0_g1~~TRINITY_DN14453_c0_g1_i4.p1  ORF type:complete len:348 (-),score=66.98 TRINITY_DN14453_c0_g1_i4:173-1216(-)
MFCSGEMKREKIQDHKGKVLLWHLDNERNISSIEQLSLIDSTCNDIDSNDIFVMYNSFNKIQFYNWLGKVQIEVNEIVQYSQILGLSVINEKTFACSGKKGEIIIYSYKYDSYNSNKINKIQVEDYKIYLHKDTNIQQFILENPQVSQDKIKLIGFHSEAKILKMLNNRILLAAGKDVVEGEKDQGFIRLYDIFSHEQKANWSTQTSQVYCLDIIKLVGNSYRVICGTEKKIQIWEINEEQNEFKNKLIAQKQTNDQLFQICFINDNQFGICQTFSSQNPQQCSQLHIYSMNNLDNPVIINTQHSDHFKIAYLQNNRFLTAGYSTRDSKVYLWTIQNNEQELSLIHI